MNNFFLFLRMVGYSSTKAVMKPSTVQNYEEIIDHYFAALSTYTVHSSCPHPLRSKLILVVYSETFYIISISKWLFQIIKNCVLKHQVIMYFTWLSSPSIRSMEKKRMAHREDMGSWVTAWGYARNAKPGPERSWSHSQVWLDLLILHIRTCQLNLWRYLHHIPVLSLLHKCLFHSNNPCSHLYFINPGHLFLFHYLAYCIIV